MNPESLSELIEKIAKDLVASGKAGSLTEDLIPAAEKLAVMREKMKENKNINKNTHHKSYIKVIIVKFTQDTRADIIKEKGGVNK